MRHKPLPCACGKALDAATSATTAAHVDPKAGDVSVCFYCGRLYQFGPDLGLQPVDLHRAGLDPEAKRLVKRIRRVLRRPS